MWLWICLSLNDLAYPLEVTKRLPLNTYIKTMALAAFLNTHTHMLIDRCTGEVDQITSASELLRCDGIARILTWDVWGGGKKSQKGLCYTSTIQAYTTDPRLAVSALPDGRNSKSGNALLLYLAACMVNRWATLKWCISLRLPNNESATYIRSGNNSRTNQWLPHFFFFLSLLLFFF